MPSDHDYMSKLRRRIERYGHVPPARQPWEEGEDYIYANSLLEYIEDNGIPATDLWREDRADPDSD